MACLSTLSGPCRRYGPRKDYGRISRCWKADARAGTTLEASASTDAMTIKDAAATSARPPSTSAGKDDVHRCKLPNGGFARTLFIKNLNFTTTTTDLRSLFEPKWTVRACSIVTQKDPTKAVQDFLSDLDSSSSHRWQKPTRL